MVQAGPIKWLPCSFDAPKSSHQSLWVPVTDWATETHAGHPPSPPCPPMALDGILGPDAVRLLRGGLESGCQRVGLEGLVGGFASSKCSGGLGGLAPCPALSPVPSTISCTDYPRTTEGLMRRKIDPQIPPPRNCPQEHFGSYVFWPCPEMGALLRLFVRVGWGPLMSHTEYPSLHCWFFTVSDTIPCFFFCFLDHTRWCSGGYS